MTISFSPTLLNDRTIIEAKGEDVLELLQDLLSCDMESLESGKAIYGFLLTPQGRFLHEFFILMHGETLWLDTQKKDVEACLKRLKLYTLRAKASFTMLENAGVIAASEKTTDHPQITCVTDPRYTELGLRIYGTQEALSNVNATEDANAYNAHRIALGIPNAEDFEPEKTLLLDYHADQLGGVDFDKGCYVGQEVTARMHYRAIDKKGIYIVKAICQNQLPPFGSEIMHDGKTAGRLLSHQGKTGIAILRHEHAGATLVTGDCQLAAIRPSWASIPAKEATT